MSTTACDYDVAVRILQSDGSTVRVNLNDPANGLSVVSVQEPEETQRQLRVDAPLVDGTFAVASVDDDGQLVVVVDVDGTTWAQIATRWEAVRTHYRAEDIFYLQTEIEGVTKTWQTERPDVSVAGIESSSLTSKLQTYSMRWRVQPNPTVTIA